MSCIHMHDIGQLVCSTSVMKINLYRASFGVIFGLSALIFGCAPHFDVVISPDGEVRSLQAAVDKVRQLRAANAIPLDRQVTVCVKRGRYRVESPVELKPEDSGIVFVGDGMRTSVFDGALELPPFRQAGLGVWEADVPRGMDFEQLWVGDRRATRARSPNGNYMYMADLDVTEPRRRFYAEKKDVLPLERLTEKELARVLLSYWQSWDMGFSRIDSIDFKTGLVALRAKATYPLFYWHRTRPRYVLENFREALDAPGEWFLDVENSKLLYIPRKDENLQTARAYAPVVRTIVRLRGDRSSGAPVRDVVFRGIGFEHTAISFGSDGIANVQAAANVKDAAVECHGVENVTFKGCRISHTAANGLRFLDGSRNVSVNHCLIEDLGAGAVGFSGGYEKDWISEGLHLRESIIRSGGRIFQGAVGVWIGYARDCAVEYNDISDFYYSGISCGWTWGYAKTINRRNRIAFNRVHHIGQGVLSDMAAIYTLGDNDGSVVCNNWIHDINGYRDNGCPTFGLYTDEGSHGITFASNLIERCRYCPLHQHFGKENLFVNNLCVDFESYGVLRSLSEPHITMALTNNVFWWRSPAAHPYTGWGSFEAMTKNVPANGNVYWSSGGFVSPNGFHGRSWEEWRKAGQDVDGAIADPLFVDPAKGDWRLRSGSPALKAGFVPFDWRRAGVEKADKAWNACAEEELREPFEDAPKAPRYAAKSYRLDMENLPLGNVNLPEKAAMLRVDGRIGAFVGVDKNPYAGKRALRFVESEKEHYVFAPHVYATVPVTGRIVRVCFAFRPVSGDGMAFEVRHNDTDKGVFSIGSACRYVKGVLSAGGADVCRIPTGVWAFVEIEMSFSGRSEVGWSISVTLPGGGRFAKKFTSWENADFKEPNWFGFMSYGDDASLWDIDEFSVVSE